MSSLYAALLRGINVGGRHSLPMQDLRQIFDDAGCGDVRTYIQSGNVVFESEPALVDKLPAMVGAEIERRFGYDIPIIIRSAAALRRTLTRNPFLDRENDHKKLHVGFLLERPRADRTARLEPERFAPDVFRLIDSEIYLHYPNGAARSKMTNQYFDSVLETSCTLRNWRTVSRLVEMTTPQRRS